MLKRLRKWFRPKKVKLEDDSAMTVQLLHMLDITREDEISCGDVHELIDQYVELKLQGEDVEALMPLMKHHLDMCRECFDEYEALLAALKFEKAL